MLAKASSRGHLRIWRLLLAHVLLISLIACGGCGKESGPIAQEQTNLAWLGSMYGRYISANQGKPPQTIDALKKFVAARTSQDQLGRLKVASVEELFKSPRDGRPFEMVTYKQLPAPQGGQPPPIVLYESVGQNGQRAVAYPGGNTRTVSESELAQLLPAGARAR